MRADRDIDFHARRHMIAQHFRDTTNRLRMRRWVLNNSNGDDLASLRITLHVGRHDDFMRQTFMIGHHETDAALRAKASHHAMGIALQHFDDGAVGAAASINTDNTHHGAIAVHQTAHLARRQKHIVAPAVRHQKTKTVGMTDDATAHQVLMIDEHKAFATIADQLTVARHGVQTAAQGFELIFIMQIQRGGDLLKIQRLTAGGDMRKNELATRDRIFVLTRLARRVRVGRGRFIGAFAAFAGFTVGHSGQVFREPNRGDAAAARDG